MDVVGHDDEGVKFVVSFGAVMLEGFDEEFGVTFDLKEATAVVGSAGGEESALKPSIGSLTTSRPFSNVFIFSVVALSAARYSDYLG